MGIPSSMERHAEQLRKELYDQTDDLRCALFDLNRAVLDEYSVDDVKRAVKLVFESLGVLTEKAEKAAAAWDSAAEEWTDEKEAGK